MTKEKKIYQELNINMKAYRRDYKGFSERSDRIEEREYWDQCREEKEFEVLNSYGVI